MSAYFEKFANKKVSSQTMRVLRGGNCIPYKCYCGVPSIHTFTACGDASSISGWLEQECGDSANTPGASCVVYQPGGGGGLPGL